MRDVREMSDIKEAGREDSRKGTKRARQNIRLETEEKSLAAKGGSTRIDHLDDTHLLTSSLSCQLFLCLRRPLHRSHRTTQENGSNQTKPQRARRQTFLTTLKTSSIERDGQRREMDWR